MIRRVIHIPGSRRHKSIVAEMDKFYPGNYQLYDAIQNKQHPTKGLSDTIKKIITENYEEPFIHILEDDVRFTSENSVSVYEHFFSRLPPDWDIYIGGSYHFGIKKDHIGLFELDHFSSLHCTMINKRAYDKILLHDHSQVNNLDDYLGRLSQANELKVFMPYPMIAIQAAGFSHIRNQIVNYDSMLKKYLLLK